MKSDNYVRFMNMFEHADQIIEKIVYKILNGHKLSHIDAIYVTTDMLTIIIQRILAVKNIDEHKYNFLQFIIKHNNVYDFKYFYDMMNFCNIDFKPLIMACKQSELFYPQWITYCKLVTQDVLENIDIDEINKYYTHAFIVACEYGNLKIIKWLYELKNNPIHGKTININVSDNNNEAFRKACMNEQLDTCDFLTSIINVDIASLTSLYEICKNEDLMNATRWLRNKINSH